jgi:hypothetical protein
MLCNSKEKRGSVIVLVAVTMAAVLGVLAIAMDGGLLLEKKRTVQAVADAAALAAATDLWEHYATNNGLDPARTAYASAMSTAAANGFIDDVNSVVTVNIGPASGNFANRAGYAEVIIRFNQARGFSSIFGSGSLPVTARAVAGGNPGNIAILMLNPHETVAAQIGDNVNIANNGQIFINSDGTVYGEFGSNHGHNAIYVESTGHLTSGGINSVGTLGIEAGGTITYTGGGGLTTGMSPVADPLASIPEPDPTGQPNYGSPKYTVASTMQPGIYDNITIAKNVHVTMAPGIYYIHNGGMQLSTGSSLTGDGVMFYDMPNDYFGGSGIPVGASINLSPPTSGFYRGISVFEPRDMNKEVHIKSNGDITMSGALYSLTGEFDLRPLLATTVFNFGAYIADLAEWSPNGVGTINLNPTTSAPTKRRLLVE